MFIFVIFVISQQLRQLSHLDQLRFMINPIVQLWMISGIYWLFIFLLLNSFYFFILTFCRQTLFHFYKKYLKKCIFIFLLIWRTFNFFDRQLWIFFNDWMRNFLIRADRIRESKIAKGKVKFSFLSLVLALSWISFSLSTLSSMMMIMIYCRQIEFSFMFLMVSDDKTGTLDGALDNLYCRSQIYLSRQMSRLRPELTMPIFSGLLNIKKWYFICV